MNRVHYLAHRFPVITETFTVNEIRSLREHGLDVEVHALRPPPSDLPDELVPLAGEARVLRLAGSTKRLPRAVPHAWGLTATALGRRAPRRLLGLLRGAELAAVLRPGDHVHAQFPLEASTAALYGAAFAGTTYSFSGHTLHQLDLMPQKLVRALFVTVGSEFERDVLTERYGAEHRDRIHVRRLGVPPRPQRTVAIDRLVVAAGTLSAKKGHDVLVRALAQLPDEVRLEIVGEGPERPALELLVRELGLAGRVTFRGALGYAQTLAVMGRATVFALCCRLTPDGDHDCLPVALMDAMSIGVPVVSTNALGIPELIEDGDSGLLAPPDDAAATAEAVARVIKDPVLAARLGTAGRATVREGFDLERNTRALAQLFLSQLT